MHIFVLYTLFLYNLKQSSQILLFMFNIWSGTLSVITNSSGGIIDDCIVTRTGRDSFYLVSNAGREDVDMTHMMVPAGS